MENNANELNADMEASLDDFTHISIDKSMSTSFNKSQFSQVVFHDLNDIYPSDVDIRCKYSLTDNVKPQAGDKVAIFKVGWMSISDYITFVRPELPPAQFPSNIPLEVVFKADSFVKKENELYQLCYVTSGNVIAGASTPFSFNRSYENDLIAVEDPTDPGLIVFKSKVEQLETELAQKSNDLALLLPKHHLLNEKFNILKQEFDKMEIELADTKEKNQELLSENENKNIDLKVLIKEVGELKAFNELLESCNKSNELENDKKKTEMQKRLIELEEMRKELDSVQINYQKVIQEYKEIDENNKELKKTNDSLKIDNEKFIKENEQLKDDKKQLEFKLEENEKMLIEKFKENENLRLQLGELRISIVLLQKEKDDSKEKLIKIETETENLQKQLTESKDLVTDLLSENRPEGTSNDEYIDMLKTQYESLEVHHSKCESRLMKTMETLQNYVYERDTLYMKIHDLDNQLKNYKFLNNEHQQQQDKASGSSCNFNGGGGGGMEGGRGPPPLATDLFKTFSDKCAQVYNLFDISGGGLNKVPDATTAWPKCTKCEQYEIQKKQSEEKQKKILEQKSNLSEDLIKIKHEHEETVRSVVDFKEINAALNSRIKVLENEVASYREQQQKQLNIKDGVVVASTSSSPITSRLITDQLDSLNNSLLFNNLISEQKSLLQNLQEERNTNLILQSKVEFLLNEDSKMSNRLQELNVKYEQLKKQQPIDINISKLKEVIDKNELKIHELNEKLTISDSEKIRLQHLVNDLRKELVGKVSVENLSEYKTQIADLERMLKKKQQECKYLAEFIQNRLNDRQGDIMISCPICPAEYPAIDLQSFSTHFESHFS